MKKKIIIDKHTQFIKPYGISNAPNIIFIFFSKFHHLILHFQFSLFLKEFIDIFSLIQFNNYFFVFLFLNYVTHFHLQRILQKFIHHRGIGSILTLSAIRHVLLRTFTFTFSFLLFLLIIFSFSIFSNFCIVLFCFCLFFFYHH